MQIDVIAIVVIMKNFLGNFKSHFMYINKRITIGMRDNDTLIPAKKAEKICRRKRINEIIKINEVFKIYTFT